MSVVQPARALQTGDVLLVVHDFDARSGDELTLRRNERVELLELDDGFGDGWYLGKHLTRGGTGLFPGVYTTKAPITVVSASHSRSPSSFPQSVAPIQLPQESAGAQQSPSVAYSPDSVQSPILPSLGDLFTPLMDSQVQAEHLTATPQYSVPMIDAQKRDYIPESQVMNDTINVIDEHITDLSNPKQDKISPPVHDHDSGSEYSGRHDRQSFIAGPETDEEDNGYSSHLNEVDVREWSPAQTAEYLRKLGVDPKHCEIFKSQDISGDVLLDMDQSFIYMKEYDFGLMGRRLKTWHKIRDFQREVKFGRTDSVRTSERDQDSFIDNGSATNLASGQAGMPRTSSVYEKNLSFRRGQTSPLALEEGYDKPGPLQPQSSSKRSSWAAQASPSASRMNDRRSVVKDHSRRYSSIDLGTQTNLESSLTSGSSHRKQTSLDRSWSIAESAKLTTPASSIKPSFNDSALEVPSLLADTSPGELDRGYFSGTEVENYKTRDRLSKLGFKSGHSRQTSMVEQSTKRDSARHLHSRSSSVEVSGNSSGLLSPAAQAYHRIPSKGRFRSSSARTSFSRATSAGHSPTVTNLEQPSPTGLSPALEKQSIQDRARKLMGFRTSAEAVTADEKTAAQPGLDVQDPVAVNPSPNQATATSSPSAPNSLDIDSPGTSLRGSETPLTSRNAASRPKVKTKQGTSAYVHGLLKIPPAEARKHCDYSGWMKKKSSSLMTTWKPRLFILRGRRLSYYYSENDAEERGIIDISGHKVLIANDIPTTLHATVTRSTSKPSPSSTPSLAEASTKSSHFFFKLVPPKAGLSRAVQFTKPMIHYFQVDSLVEGRRWMGEILKMTIEHDLSSYETTNKQKTISLAKARARMERPPALNDTKKIEAAESNGDNIESAGLNIQGAGLQSDDHAAQWKPLPSVVEEKPLPPQPQTEETPAS